MAFFLSTIAGLATLFGILPIFLPFDSKKMILPSLSFAAGVMTSVSLFDLIPESFNLLHETFSFVPTIIFILIFINIGIIFGNTIDHMVTIINQYYKLGIISLIAIIIHNIPEGMITFLTSNSNLKLGIILTFAIFLHNIPEGISIAVPIYHAKKSRGVAIFYVLIAALAEPLGALFAFCFLKNIEYQIIIGILLAFTAGIMLQIAFLEFLPMISKNLKKGHVLIYFLGVIIVLLSNLL